MSIVNRIRAGAPCPPTFQADTGLGSSADEAPAQARSPKSPPPKSPRQKSNGAAKKAAATASGNDGPKNDSPKNDSTEIAIDGAVQTDPVAPGPDTPQAIQATGQAPNPLASAIALMTASAPHRHLFVADLEWALLPPIALRQCRVFVKDNRPVGFASWAFVSDEVEARLKAGQTKLKPSEWKSGENCWLIDLIAPFGGAEGFVRLLTDGVLKEHRPSLSALVQFTVRNATKKKAQGEQEQAKQESRIKKAGRRGD